ncbi:family 43 glycosylhydrolase [Paenibacillus aceris]|uniref:GH43 family beta-xylosidase n=1 Tax=Paenibacillus aceris TaxID=869555 RepID=A0ABS4I333_9BACL|nr:family 43 glycosylhydrolase [Paenibacillus aceris]MBP1964584.1 GH43 family beta-xylosidase [Paenibacillus aceris]NHW35708.1 family 43 glycosylhydrolase [Paenibacillus aceris]
MKKVVGILMAIILFACTINMPLNASAADPTMDGHGLMGDFFKCIPNPDNRTDINVFKFDDLRGSRAIGNLNGDSFGSIFNQFSGTPDYNTARFTGTIVPKYTENYTFHMVGDDGFRLWVNGQLIIDFWQQTWEKPQDSIPISLEAGKHYDIKVEYLQGWGGTWLRMEWESANQKREIVPESALYLPADRMIVTKKADLTAEIQKLDYLTENFADKVNESALNHLHATKITAEELLNTIDANTANDRDKLDLLINGIEAVSIARSEFMKEMGVTSSSVSTKFNNPLYQGQDPFVTYKDGFYYFVSSSNLDSNNKVYVSKSRTLTDQGEKIQVFDSQGTQTRIFAPEIFFFDGKWYIYYCADLQAYGYKHMATVLESVSDDPQGAYVDKGALYAGENGVYKQANDFTVFENKGKLYAVWGTLGSGEPIGPAIAPMDNPYTITADRSFLPGGGGEGPRVLQKDGKVFITMSEGDYASDGYRLSYFMNTDGNFLNPSSWTRKNDVFVSTSDVSGPARAGFVKSVDGKEDWMIYHSRVYQDTGRNWWRQVNIKKFGWNEDGTPNFGVPVSPNKWQNLPSGDLGQGDMFQAEDAILLGEITKDNSHLNYQGTGYINLPKKSGAEANFVVNAAENGDYIVGVRYAYGEQVNGESTNNPTVQLPARAQINVYVNGKHVKTIAPDKTAISWDEWFTASERLSLKAGKNVISYRIDNGNIGNVNLDHLTMYKADVPNSVETTELSGTLTGASQISSGSNFELNYGLSHVSSSVNEAIYAQDLTFDYNPDTFNFVSVESLKEGLLVVDVKKDVPGHVRVLLASLGANHSITTDGGLLKLTWKAIKESANASITLSQAKLANAAGVESSLNSVTHTVQVTGTNELNKEALNALIAQSQAAVNAAVEGSAPGQYPIGSKAALQAAIDAAITASANARSQAEIDQAASILTQALQAFKNSVNTSLTGDINGDGKVTIGDIAIAAASYGKNSTSPDWNVVQKVDVNHDGVIDIADLAIIARAIFQ